MNLHGRYTTEEEENFLNHMKSLVENVDEVERKEISGSVKKGTGVFGISDLDVWVITRVRIHQSFNWRTEPVVS